MNYKLPLITKFQLNDTTTLNQIGYMTIRLFETLLKRLNMEK